LQRADEMPLEREVGAGEYLVDRFLCIVLAKCALPDPRRLDYVRRRPGLADRQKADRLGVSTAGEGCLVDA